jgi:hypothetical protein
MKKLRRKKSKTTKSEIASLRQEVSQLRAQMERNNQFMQKMKDEAVVGVLNLINNHDLLGRGQYIVQKTLEIAREEAKQMIAGLALAESGVKRTFGVVGPADGGKR